MTNSWCKEILIKKLSPIQRQRKFSTLEKFARASFPVNGCFSLEWLAHIVEKIDELYYQGRMLPQVYEIYGGLRLHVDSPEQEVAGYVLESADCKNLSLHMNRDLFASLFQKEERGYHSGGLLCEDRLVCFLHVVLHETVHIILVACENQGHIRNIRDHGKEFKRITRHLFGQTDPQHGLIPGYEQFHDLETIRKNIRPGTHVQVYLGRTGGPEDEHTNPSVSRYKWVDARVVKKGRKWVKVKLLEQGKPVFITVHAGLLRLVET